MKFHNLTIFALYNAIIITAGKPTTDHNKPAQKSPSSLLAPPSSSKKNIFVVARIYQFNENFTANTKNWPFVHIGRGKQTIHQKARTSSNVLAGEVFQDNNITHQNEVDDNNINKVENKLVDMNSSYVVFVDSSNKTNSNKGRDNSINNSINNSSSVENFLEYAAVGRVPPDLTNNGGAAVMNTTTTTRTAETSTQFVVEEPTPTRGLSSGEHSNGNSVITTTIMTPHVVIDGDVDTDEKQTKDAFTTTIMPPHVVIDGDVDTDQKRTKDAFTTTIMTPHVVIDGDVDTDEKQTKDAFTTTIMSPHVVIDGDVDTDEKQKKDPSTKTTLPAAGNTATTTSTTTATTTSTIKTTKSIIQETATKSPHNSKPKTTDKCNCNCSKNDKTVDENKNGEAVKQEFDPQLLLNFKPPVTSLSSDELHYQLADYIIKFVFKHYPELQIPLLAKVLSNGTTHRAYSGMIMEFQQPNSFDILVTDSYSQINDGTSRRIEQYPSLYQCSKAIRYCSVNPKFCQYQEGDYDTNIIITVPHGGNFKPVDLRERATGCYDNQRCVFMHDCEKYGGIKDEKRCGVDTHPNPDSRDVALLLADRIKNTTGHRPHIVIMELHHSIIDVDAFEAEGTFGDGQMRTTWKDFHNFVSIAKLKVSGRGILLDIHTHSRTHGLVELGYAISKSQLERDEVDPKNSSINSLARYVQVPFESILRGKNSLGDILRTKNIEAFPSSVFVKPEGEISDISDEKQTIVKLYGSMYGGDIDAIRISTPRKYYTKTEIEEYSTLLSNGIREYMDLNYVNRGNAT